MRNKYYEIVVRPQSEFKTEEYRTDMLDEGIVRLAGRRMSGLWDTQAWFLSEEHARMKNGKLIPVTEPAKHVVKTLASEPKWVKTNVFRARDKFKIP